MFFDNNGISVIPGGFEENNSENNDINKEKEAENKERVMEIHDKLEDFLDQMADDYSKKGINLQKPAVLAAMNILSIEQILRRSEFDDDDFTFIKSIQNKLIETQDERCGDNIVHEMVGCYAYLSSIAIDWLEIVNK